MIGKVMTGKNFDGCARYVLRSKGATILDSKGIRTVSPETIIQDFNMQHKANPNVVVAVGHIALSWSPNDTSKLTPGRMAAHAREYLEKMKITGTQYLIVQHHDREHPHIHIIYNRVNNDCKSISDQFQKNRNIKVTQEITLKYGYHLSKGKVGFNINRMWGVDKIKYALYEALSTALKYSANWKELTRVLKHDAISVQFHCMGGSQRINGVSFRKGNICIKGSRIDRSLSFENITRRLTHNESLVLDNLGLPDMSESIDRSSSRSSAFSEDNGREIMGDLVGAVTAKSSELKRIDEDVSTIMLDSPSIENDGAWDKSHDKINSEETIIEIPHKRKR